MGSRKTALRAEARYAKQILFDPIGPEGQHRIASSIVTLIGLGALGTVIANDLCRAGVGRLRLVDRDFVELSNLQRQTLYDEEDALQRMPKAIAAARKLREINSDVHIDPLVSDVDGSNVEELIAGSTVVLDGTDNLETRFLLNDACVKMGLPWIYGGALGSAGNTMTIVPGQTACLRCLMDEIPPPGMLPTCDTEGVLAAVTGVVGSIESAEALRLITGKLASGHLLCVDVWDRDFRDIPLERRDDCPACGHHHYQYLAGERASWTTVLCGRNAVQIMPPGEHTVSLDELERRLSKVGRVTNNGFLLSLTQDELELVLFPNGRAIIRGTKDEAQARSLYARYVGI